MLNDFQFKVEKHMGYEGTTFFALLTGAGAYGITESEFFDEFWVFNLYEDIRKEANNTKMLLHCYHTDRDISIRPVIDYDFIKANGVIYKPGRTLDDTLLQFGEYPQSREKDKLMIDNLDFKYSNNTLNKTGKKYTIDSTIFCKRNIAKNAYIIDKKASKKIFEPLEFEEYECNGKKYIRFIMNENSLSFYNENKKGDVVWVRVEPIVWKKIGNFAIATKSIVSGIQFDNREIDGKCENYTESNMYKYLNNYMRYEILPLNEYLKYKNLDNQKSDSQNDLEKIISEIRNVIKEYEEVIKEPEFIKLKDEIYQNIDILIDKYNRQIDEYINKMNSNTFGVKSPDILELELKVKLESYLDELNSFILPIGSYYKMIDILSLNENKDNSNDDLLQDLKQIKDVILPYLGNEQVVLEYKDFIVNEISNLKNESSSKEVKDLETLKLEFRKKLNDFLLKFDVSINNKSYIIDLINDAKEDGSLEKRKNSNNLYDIILNEIIKTRNYIVINGNADERKKSLDIMQEFDFIMNKDNIVVDDFINILKVTLYKLSYIEFDIILRTNAEMKLGIKRIRKIK